MLPGKYSIITTYGVNVWLCVFLEEKNWIVGPPNFTGSTDPNEHGDALDHWIRSEHLDHRIQKAPVP